MAERAPWNSKRPFQRQYQVHRHNAKTRGIDWNFTYDTWIEWWGEDVVNRGHSKGKLVMARNGDTGPYSPENCQKLTHGQNASDGRTGYVMSEESKAKISFTKAMKKAKDMI